VDLYNFDGAYLEGLLARDAAIEQHFAQYFGELLLIVLRARHFHRDAINDIRQETLMRVLKAVRAREIRDPRSLRGYVHSVCKNVMREFARAEGRTSAQPEDGPEPADERADSERELVNRERVEMVRGVLAEIPDKDRALLSAVLEEKSSAEICRQFGVDANYLRVRMCRARKRFLEVALRRGAGRQASAG